MIAFYPGSFPRDDGFRGVPDPMRGWKVDTSLITIDFRPDVGSEAVRLDKK